MMLEERIIGFFGLRPAPAVPASASAPAPVVKPPQTANASPSPATGVVATMPLPAAAPADTIPADSLTFVEAEEDGSAAYYARHYTHFEYPGGASGPTVAIGYDCGYVTAAEATADWTGLVSLATVTAIVSATGYRGAAAEAWVRQHAGSVTITWDQAVEEFTTREVPKWLKRCRAVLPNFDRLPGECQGALFSLSYNRGTGGYDDPSPRDAEMREIKSLMIAQDFAKIPAEILAMQRLWPRGGDLWNRRAHEAVLFQKGLDSAPA